MGEKRRIFCVVTQGEMGGAQRFIVQLANNIDRTRFDLHIVWGAGDGALGRHLPEWVSTGTVAHLGRGVAPLQNLRAVWELRKLIAQHQPDIVLCISSMAGFTASLATRTLKSRLPNMQVVYRIGGWTFNDPWPAYKRKAYVWLEKLSASWKGTIVVNNAHDLEQAKALGIRPRDQLVRIYNGMDPYPQFVNHEQARAYLNGRVEEHYRHTPHDFLVGTIANFYPAKGLPTLIRAAARVGGNVRFLVIGDGPQRAELEKLIIEQGLEDRFFLLGRLTDAWRYLPAFDAFVLPSLKEGFPWALLEAMVARVPAVATRVGAVPEMLEDHKSGLIVEPGQPNALATAIVEMLGNDRLRQEIAISAHQQVITKFSLREMISNYERLFA